MEKAKKDFVVFYRSAEHYEILGFVRAVSLEEAEKKAVEELDYEASHYGIAKGMIFEMGKGREISFMKGKN